MIVDLVTRKIGLKVGQPLVVDRFTVGVTIIADNSVAWRGLK